MNALVVISACICAVAGRPQYPYPVAGYPAAQTYAAVAPYVGQTTYEYNLIQDTAAAPAPLAVPYVAVAPPFVPTEYKSQYHSQDELGQYAYGHASLDQTHSAVRDYTGAVRGSYTYINENNEEIVVHYIADQGGFRVSSNALPVAPTFDGQAPVAPEFNLEAPVFDLEAPVFDLEPAMDTPEVAAAKEEHFRLVAEQIAAVAAARTVAESEEPVTEEPAAEEPAAEEPAAEEPAAEEPAAEEPAAEEPAAEEPAAEEPAAEETTEATVVEEVAEEEVAEEEVAEEETVTEAAVEADTEAPEETAAEETVERRKRQVFFPQYYKALPVKPIEVKATPIKPIVVNAIRDAELLRIVHNPGHGVSYRVY